GALSCRRISPCWAFWRTVRRSVMRDARCRGHRPAAGLERIATIRCRTRVREWRVAGPRSGAGAFRMGAGRARAGRRERAPLVGRTDSLAKLALAYGLHLTRRRLARSHPQLATLVTTYAPD